MPSPATTRRIRGWVKIAHTGFVVVLVPVYWRQYGAGNFLWFSDVALLTAVPAVWLEHRLLASTQAVATLVPETLWVFDFGARLVTGKSPTGLAGYMFDAAIPRPVRALSLFHLWLPPLLVWTVARLGYDRRAWLAQTAATTVILPVSYLVTAPQDNVNWVYGPGARRQTRVHPLLYLAGVMLFFPLCFQWPAHVLLRRLFGTRPARSDSR
jgi:hypothetical protein